MLDEHSFQNAPAKCIGHSLNSNILLEVVYWIDLNKEYYGNENLLRLPRMSKAHYLINLQPYIQTIDGKRKRKREQIWGS